MKSAPSKASATGGNEGLVLGPANILTLNNYVHEAAAGECHHE